MEQGRRRTMMYVGAALVVAILLGWGVANRAGRAGAAEEPRVVVVQADGERKEMSIEEYVAGVVAGEMKEGWPEEAYAAQAILARTFALRYMEESGGNEIPAEHEKAQAYAPENITPVIRRAVERTRGEVVTYRGEPINAWFHAYSGGETATAREGLGFADAEPPYIKSVKVPENNVVDEELKNWRATFSPEEIRRALKETHDIDVGTIRRIEATEKGPTGRLTRVTIVGSEGRETLSGHEFRLALGAFKMKSAKVTEFDFDPEEGLTVEGTGFGHGVGLSQWDALMFARDGRSPEDIVRFFYQDVEIEQRW